VAVGTLIGVLFIGRSIAAPAATGMGVLLAYAGLVPLQELLAAQGNGATRTGHLALASPAVLLKNALGFTILAGSIPATTTRTWISLLGIILGAFGLAVWVSARWGVTPGAFGPPGGGFPGGRGGETGETRAPPRGAPPPRVGRVLP